MGSVGVNTWRNCRKGRPVAILANGPSLDAYDFAAYHLQGAPMDTLGMNASFMAHWATWHIAIERDQWDQFPGVYRELHRQRKLFVICANWPVGHKILPLPEGLRDANPFSFDLQRGIVEGVNGIGSIAYGALQLAVWMGYGTIYFLGLDLGPVGGKGHFHGKAPADPLMGHQNELFHLAADELHGTEHVVLVVGASRCTAFPRASSAEEAQFPRKGAR